MLNALIYAIVDSILSYILHMLRLWSPPVLWDFGPIQIVLTCVKLTGHLEEEKRKQNVAVSRNGLTCIFTNNPNIFDLFTEEIF